MNIFRSPNGLVCQACGQTEKLFSFLTDGTHLICAKCRAKEPRPVPILSVKIMHKVNSWNKPSHACWGKMLRKGKTYCWILNQHGNTDKYRLDGKPIGGSHYFIQMHRPGPGTVFPWERDKALAEDRLYFSNGVTLLLVKEILGKGKIVQVVTDHGRYRVYAECGSCPDIQLGRLVVQP